MKRLFQSLLLLCASSLSLAAADDLRLSIEAVSANVYLVKSYKTIEDGETGNPVVMDANAVIYRDGNNAYLIDTPWNVADMPAVNAWIDERGLTLKGVVVTHYHEDRSAGLDYLQQQGIASFASKETNALLKQHGKTVAQHTLVDKEAEVLKDKIEVYYPGPGHSQDNVVVWLPNEKTLIGGCLLRALETDTLGWVGDADVRQWSQSVRKVQIKYPDAIKVIPGHGEVGIGQAIIEHTLKVSSASSGKS